MWERIACDVIRCCVCVTREFRNRIRSSLVVTLAHIHTTHITYTFHHTIHILIGSSICFDFLFYLYFLRFVIWFWFYLHMCLSTHACEWLLLASQSHASCASCIRALSLCQCRHTHLWFILCFVILVGAIKGTKVRDSMSAVCRAVSNACSFVSFFLVSRLFVYYTLSLCLAVLLHWLHCSTPRFTPYDINNWNNKW